MTRNEFYQVAELLTRQMPWSLGIFGEGRRTLGICNHIREELLEIEESPDDLEEWVDVILLAFDGAWRTGAEVGEIVDALYDKQIKNVFSRKWQPITPEDEANFHVPSEDGG